MIGFAIWLGIFWAIQLFFRSMLRSEQPRHRKVQLRAVFWLGLVWPLVAIWLLIAMLGEAIEALIPPLRNRS